MKQWQKLLAVFGIVLGPVSMGISFSLINTCLESIYQYFGASLLQLQWMINLYGIFIASTLVAMGRFGDIFGRKKLFIVGNVLFLIAMIGSGLAVVPSMIIAFMPLYGLAGAILLPISQAMIVSLYPEEKKSTAIGIWAGMAGSALAVGPLIGGLVMSYLHWRWIFLINIPSALLCIGVVYFFCPESKAKGGSVKIDWTGLGLLFFTVGSFVLATIQSNLWEPWIIGCLYFLSVLSLVVLLAVEMRAESPIIREDLFKSRTFLLSSIGGLCKIGFFWGAIFLIPLFIQKELLYEPLEAGFLLFFLTSPIAVLSPFSGLLYRKIGAKNLFLAGFSFLAFSTYLFSGIDHQSEFGSILLALITMGLGFAILWAPLTTHALSVVPNHFLGVAAGTFVTLQEIGGNVGLALSGTAIRNAANLVEGFAQGLIVLFFFCMIGVASAVALPRVKE